MKRKILSLSLTLLLGLFSWNATAATGWFSDYIKLNVNGTGVAAPTGWYWIGANPTYATQFEAASLGTVTSLILDGADMQYWSDTQDRTGSSFFYRILSSNGLTEIVAPVETALTQTGPTGNNYQGTASGLNINLLTAALNPSTTYKLQVYAKSTGSGQGDSWLTNFGANFTATFTTPAVLVSGSASQDGGYTTLGAAITAIGLTQSSKNIVIKIGASTTEPSAITIGAGTWASIKIYPTASSVICSTTNITLSGAKNVTIDGRVNRTGSPAVGASTSLTLSSTSTTAPVILFDNDAQTDSIKYCTLKIGAVTTIGGITFGATTTATNGNGLNVIDRNLITSSGATYPIWTIYATGNTTNPNKGNQITNNWFTNFLNTTGNPIGIYILGNATSNINDNYTISGNSMYGNITVSGGGTRTFMQIGAAGNAGSHTISGNYIGGQSANCGGNKMTQGGSVASHLLGIGLYTSGSGTSLVQNNTIKNINWTSYSGSRQDFNAIQVLGTGAATISDNVIGNNTTSAYNSTASIIHSMYGSTAGNFNGINISTTGAVTCSNNQIGSIKAYNGSGTGSAGFTLSGINKSGGGTIVISNNTIGSITAPNSINDSITNTTLYSQTTTGIVFSGSGTCTIANNTIANLTNRTSVGYLYGINMNGTLSTGTVNGNLIHSNKITGYTGTGALIGIHSNAGTNTITNNIVKLGDNNACHIRGIGDNIGSNIYHNTVYLSGAPTSGAFTSSSLYCGVTTNRNYKNNILVNTRSNTSPASGEHYAFSTTSATATGINIDGNNYYSLGTGGFLGKIGINSAQTDKPFFTGQDAASYVGNPTFATAGGTLATDYIASNSLLTGVSGTNVLNDYAGTNRTAATMGAYFKPTIVPVPSGTVNSGDLTLTGASQIEVGAGAELTLNSVLPTISKIILAPTAKLTMGSNTIDAPNGVIFQSDATGTATVTGDAAVSNATVQQHLTSGRNWYISPSVSAGTASMLSRGDSVVAWNETLTKWEKVTSNLTAGRGYIQTAVSGHGTTGTVNFTGTTNTGDIITSSLTRTGEVSTSGFNLVGNPYPSYLRWSGTNSVIADANNSGIGTSFWYRTKSDADAYIFVTHNGTSGYTIPSGQTANTTYTGVIPPMQAFWVRVTTSPTTMKFTNVMRLHADNTLNKFKAPKIDERQRLRLQLANGTATDEALIYFDASAANNFDNYDSPKMLNNSTRVPDLYSKTDNEKLVINGLTSVTDNMTLPLGFTLKAAATGLILKVNELSNFAVGTKVYLLDNDQSTQTELLPETQYTFNTTTANTNNESRFSLLFRAPGVTTGIYNSAKLNAQVFVNAANQIVIIAPLKSNYAIYNAMGQLMENGAMTSNSQTSNIKHAAGVYFVKVGNTNSTRVIIK